MVMRHWPGPRRRWWFLVLALAMISSAAGQKPADELAPGSPYLIQPEELAKALKTAQKPVVLYVGPRFLYRQAHIPGAEYMGMGESADGREKLRARAASLGKAARVVLYCGCCPWENCPNVRPAYAELKKAGLAKVRVLYLATNFATDWKNKRYPVASGD